MKLVWVKGVRFNVGSKDKFFKKVGKELKAGVSLTKKKRPFVIFTPNPEQVVQAWEDEEFRECLNNSDLNLVDGVGIVWYLRLKHKIKTYRVSGADFGWELIRIVNDLGGKVFVLGAGEGVNEAVQKRLKKEFEGLKVRGLSGGLVGEDGWVDKEVIEEINRFRPDLLLVAFGAPKQEKFVCRYKEVLKVKVVMVVGGAFDYWANVLPRAPRWVQELGLEWLFRLIIEPWRIKRQVRLVKFVVERGV